MAFVGCMREHQKRGPRRAGHPLVQNLLEDKAESMPFTAKALSRRLRVCSGIPPWANYASLEVKLLMGWPVSTPATSSTPDSSSERSCRSSDAEAVLGQVWRLARSSEGTRVVQDAFDLASTDEVRMALAEELRGRSWEAAMCPHANYVLQKCIMTMQPQQVDFIIRELSERDGGVVQVAQHKYGCRIVQRLLEHCLPSQVAALVDEILDNALATARHPFGNYVLQKILEVGEDGQRRRLIGIITANVHRLGSDVYACPVVSKAMVCGDAEEKAALAQALAPESELLAAMARTRQGQLAVKHMAEALGEPVFGIDGGHNHTKAGATQAAAATVAAN
eukprot:TRINITY_DN23893_c0_g1_i1.p1 TRINITY_DN23893_c0_g1~~TRINITY_DN23893_c0_g1_i1.p1  ORF type:complete len:336 (+),score=70.92 TRINITY_DN23893_c0_g1_i1:81-1088(+)